MNLKNRIKSITPPNVWRALQRQKANRCLASYYLLQRKQYINYCAGPWNEKQRNGQYERLRSTIVYYIHRIEKGLSHRYFRSGFGKSAFAHLNELMQTWQHEGYPTDDVVFCAAENVIRAYVRKHHEIGKPIPDFINAWFADEITQSGEQTKSYARINAGTKVVRAIDKRNNASLDYESLFRNRTSVREYADTPVDMESVREAINISMKTPSVCNRQAFRILLIRNPNLIEKSLAVQGGWRGYAAPPLLALISVDIRSFVSVEERNEPYIDGGLFTMSFLTALEYESIAACPLNTMFRDEQEREIRKLLAVPEHEVLIAFIAIGNFPDVINSPMSFRYSGDMITREID
ncbi:nitroreductase family protein [Bifidobacterium boum]|uniref:nitroreductase family protein n=1 Tax=Bifidobacterium boum TaxID=78343 RepID=UPI001F21B580|nr:nitroreductase family protein [Bifidobacterium boum]MCF2561225.1 nitroreductase family protein [Bifidobacterium boum]